MWMGGEKDKLSVKRSSKPKRAMQAVAAAAGKNSAFFSSADASASPPPRKRFNKSQLAAVSDWFAIAPAPPLTPCEFEYAGLLRRVSLPMNPKR